MYVMLAESVTLGALFVFLIPRSTSNELVKSMFVVETTPTGTIHMCRVGIAINCTRLAITAPYARSVVYDPIDDHVYWTYSEFINRIRSSGESYEHKWFHFDRKPSAVAIDHSSRLMFVLFSSGNSSLRSVSLQTRRQTEIRTPSNGLWGLAVDPLMKKIFLAEATRLTMMRYDGTSLETLVRINADYHVRMAFDPEGQTLYYNLWTLKALRSVNIHTRDTTTYSFNCQYLSMALYEGVLYMTALNERGNIFKMPREGGLISNIPYSGSEYRFARITVFRKHGCSPGWFGRTCNLACGQCLAGSTCDQMSGYCTLGCDVGWTGRTCKAGMRKEVDCTYTCEIDEMESKDGSFGSWTTSPPASQTSPWGVGCKQGWIEFTEGKPVLWTLVGGCGLLALLVCALVVVVCRCKRKLTRLRINQNKDGSCIRMDDKAYQEYLTAQDAQESNDNTYEVI